MAWMHLPIDSTKFLQIDSSDESLRAMIDHYLEKFVSAFDRLMETNKTYSATQTEEVGAKEGHPGASHSKG